MNTPIQTLYYYLKEQGLFNDWVDSEGATQSAPVVQLREFQDNTLDDNDRCLLIKVSGSGGGDRYVSMPTILFASFGKVGETPVYAEEYANKIYAALLLFNATDCLISVEPMGNVSGLFRTGSNRPVHDMEFSSKVDSGLLG